MEPVKVGIIGCGVIGTNHLASSVQAPLADVVAVADLIPERGKENSGKFDVRKVYVEGDDLLEDPEIEVVVLATPAHARFSLAMHAFKAGKHVLTEKPVAMNADQVRQMIAAKGDLVAGCCCSRYSFLPSSRAAADLVATGVLGQLRVVHCRALRSGSGPPKKDPPEWRLKRHLNGGGILMNWGCYDLDYLLGITGWTLKPKTVLAQTWTVPPKFEALAAPGSDAETHFTSLILCEGGTVITFERAEMSTARREGAWKIVGTEGSLDLQMVSGDTPRKIVHNRASSEEGVISETIWEGEETGNVVHEGPLADITAAIREGREPKTSLERALVIQQISDAIYKSAETGGAVEIE